MAVNKTGRRALPWALIKWFSLLIAAWVPLAGAGHPLYHEGDVSSSNLAPEVPAWNGTVDQIEERNGPPRCTSITGGEGICFAICYPFLPLCTNGAPTGDEYFETAFHCECWSKRAPKPQNPCLYNTELSRPGANQACNQACLPNSDGGACVTDRGLKQCICYLNGYPTLLDNVWRSKRQTSLCSHGQGCSAACPNGVRGICGNYGHRMTECGCNLPPSSNSIIKGVSLDVANELYPPTTDACAPKGAYQINRVDACTDLCRRQNNALAGQCIGFTPNDIGAKYCFCFVKYPVFYAPRTGQPIHDLRILKAGGNVYRDPCPLQTSCNGQCPEGTTGACRRIVDYDQKGHCFCQLQGATRLWHLFTAWDMFPHVHLNQKTPMLPDSDNLLKASMGRTEGQGQQMGLGEIADELERSMDRETRINSMPCIDDSDRSRLPRLNAVCGAACRQVETLRVQEGRCVASQNGISDRICICHLAFNRAKQTSYSVPLAKARKYAEALSSLYD